MHKESSGHAQNASSTTEGPQRHTVINVLDDVLLHGRAFTRAGLHYQGRTFSGESRVNHKVEREARPNGTYTRGERPRRDTPPQRPRRAQVGHINFEALSPIPHRTAHLARIHRESVAFKQAARDAQSHVQFSHHDIATDAVSCQASTSLQLESLRAIAERDACSRRHAKSMFRLATILWAMLFVLSFCGYGATLYMSKFWRVDKSEQEFEIPTWVHEVTVVGLVLELTVCIALGTRWRHYY